jgi:c-di-GMP-binding flagellar brake protein YcgR
MGSTKIQDCLSDIRYPVNTPIELELKDGTRLLVNTEKISNSGLHFSCNSWVAQKIEPKGIHLHSLNQINLKIRSEQHKLSAHAQVRYARRLSQDEYMIGVNFTDLDEGSADIVSALIGQKEKRSINS